MQSSSRRAFLTGRRVTHDPWEAFCQRVRNTVSGTFFEFDRQEGAGSARLVPKQASDVHKARALCAEYGVLLALDGVPHSARLDEQHVLWVDPGRDMSMRQRLEAGRSEEHTSELQSLMRISYAVFCLKKKNKEKLNQNQTTK